MSQQQKRAGGDDNPFGGPEQDQLKIKPPSLEIPDVHEAMRLAGVKDLEETSDEKQAKDKDAKRRNKRRTIICCCGVRGCGIGPMTNVEEEDEEI